MNNLNEVTIKDLTVAESIALIDKLRAHINKQTFGVYALGGSGDDSAKAAVVSFDLESSSMRIMVVDRVTGIRIRLIDELSTRELADYSTLVLLYDAWDGQEPISVPLVALDEVSIGSDTLDIPGFGEDCQGEIEA